MQSGMRRMQPMLRLSGITSEAICPRTSRSVSICVKNDCGKAVPVGTPSRISRAGADGSASQSV